MSGSAPYERAAAVLAGAGAVIVCAHVNPDGDAIGSVLGLTAMLRARGVRATPVLADDSRPAPVYSFLPGFEELRPIAPQDDCDVLVCLDATDPARIGGADRLLSVADEIIVVDHHPDTTPFGTVNVLDPTAAAVGLILWELAEALRVDPDPDIATCLYTALMTDTGRFQHDNTDARALHVAAAMVDAGADPATISRAVYQSRSAASVALIGLVLDRIRHVNGGRVAYSWFAPEDLETTGATLEETEELVDWVRMGAGPEAVLLVKIGDGTCRLSLRARGDADVGSVARQLGGGGHRAAAGATVPGGLDEALAAVLPLLPGGGS